MVLFSAKFLAPNPAPLLKRRPHRQHPLSPGVLHNCPHRVQKIRGLLRWVHPCAGGTRSPSGAQRCELPAAGWPCPGYHVPGVGAFGPRPLCLRTACVVDSGKGWGWGEGGVQPRQDPWAPLSALRASLGPLLAGTSWPAHVCQYCPLPFQSWGEALSGPWEAGLAAAASSCVPRPGPEGLA